MYDIDQPYGPLITSTARLVEWNVWARYGPWEERERAIEAVLRRENPDLVVLVEAWASDGEDQAARLAADLGFAHHVRARGLAVLSAWPVARHTEHVLESPRGEGAAGGEGAALDTVIDGPRGPLRVVAAAAAWRLDDSALRRDQARRLCEIVAADRELRRAPTLLCGDFNADPSSDEIRMLTGHTEVAVPGVVFYDAWTAAGNEGPGHTWSNANPWAAPVLWPNRRIDYVFSAYPRRGGAGHPTACRVIGTEPVDGAVPSDHYGLVADIRY